MTFTVTWTEEKSIAFGAEYFDFLRFPLPPLGGGDAVFLQLTLARTLRVWTSHSFQSTGDNNAAS